MQACDEGKKITVFMIEKFLLQILVAQIGLLLESQLLTNHATWRFFSEMTEENTFYLQKLLNLGN